jgi:RHS repeat-associated protein
MNRMTRMVSPDPDGSGPLQSSVTILEYDLLGHLIRTVDAAGSETRMTYDSMGRVLTQTDDASQVTRSEYDIAGNLIAFTDPKGNTTRYKYDLRGRMTQTVAADGGTTIYEYDVADNLVALTDSVGNRTRYKYDPRNRVIEEIDPLGKSIRYEYDGVGNLAKKIDRNNRTTTFSYDAANRLTQERWLNPDGTEANTIDYVYDKVGNLLRVQDVSSRLTFTYDSLNRPALASNSGTPGAPAVDILYAYDAASNITSVSDRILGVPSGVTQYTYDARNRMKSVSQHGSGVDPKLVDFVYNELGQFTQIDRFSDLQRTSLVARTHYSYDDLNRLTSLTHGTASTPRSLAFYDYEYDSANRITAITDIDGRTQYQYDMTDQLIRATRGATDPRGNESYTYDKNGNRVSSHLASHYTTGSANRLLSDGKYTYQYDAEGNTTRRVTITTGETRDFTWDHRNRLVRLTDKSSGGTIVNEASYIYDAINRRIAKLVDVDGTGPLSTHVDHYAYDREHIVLEFTDPDGPNSNAQPALSTRNVFGPQIDMIIAQEQQAPRDVQWLMADHLGSIRLVLSEDLHFENIAYDSFGNPLGATISNYGFSGREFDTETQLYYYRSRYYCSQSGVFLSEDSLRHTNHDGHNLHSYVANQPTVAVDPFGTDSYMTVIGDGLANLLSGISRATPFVPGPFATADYLTNPEKAQQEFSKVISRIYKLQQEEQQLILLIDAYKKLKSGPNTCSTYSEWAQQQIELSRIISSSETKLLKTRLLIRSEIFWLVSNMPMNGFNLSLEVA